MGYILITGATGFIGSNLLNYIKKRYPAYLDKIVLLSDGISNHELVVASNNYNFTANNFLEKGIDSIESVIHLGAFTPKDHKSANLFDENFKNITNTAYLLRNLPGRPQKFIYISSVDVYPRVDGIIDENTPAAPFTFYGSCKLFCEQMVTTYCIANNIIPQVLRLGNIYGKGESAYKKLVPETIRHLILGEAPVLYGPGEEKRSFLNVMDCNIAIWKSIELDEFIGPVNIVSSKSYMVKEIVQALINISGAALKITILRSNKELYDLIFDNGKMTKYLTGETISIYEGLAEEYTYEK